MNEIWKPISGYEGKYEVSNLGNVRTLNYRRTGKCKLLKPLTNKGYLRVDLYLNGEKKVFNIHQLVAIVFLKHKPDGHKTNIDHIDFDKHNNRLDNLRIVTSRENIHHSLPKKDLPIGVNIFKNRYLARITINGKRKCLGYFKTQEEAASAYQQELNKL